MTTAEIESLNKLEYNLQRLSKLLSEQSQLLQQQHEEISLLREQNRSLSLALEEAKERGRMGCVAEGLLHGEDALRAETLSYLNEMIDELKSSIRQLELE